MNPTKTELVVFIRIYKIPFKIGKFSPQLTKKGKVNCHKNIISRIHKTHAVLHGCKGKIDQILEKHMLIIQILNLFFDSIVW